MRERRIDLHAHTTSSDGTATPGELVEAAVAAGLDTVAITDHDTTSGWAEAIGAAERLGIALVPGIEVSTRVEGGSVHVLAYLPDPNHAGLAAELERTRTARRTRAREIVDRLGRDYALPWDAVEQLAQGGTVGRPHIADALVAAGLAVDRYDAFDRILHPRHGYTVPVQAPDPVTAIALIRDAGGVPVLAHPATHPRGLVIPADRLAMLVDAGLFGLEIEHPENTDAGKARLRELAGRFGLATLGGSDWHGAGKVNRLGDALTDEATLERLVAEAR